MSKAFDINYLVRWHLFVLDYLRPRKNLVSHMIDVCGILVEHHVGCCDLLDKHIYFEEIMCSNSLQTMHVREMGL